MTARHPEPPTETRETLEREADAVRARLESRIDAIKDRGRHATHALEVARVQAKRHAPVLIALGAAALVLTAVLAIRRRARARQRERRDLILNFAGSLLCPGFTLRPPEPRQSFIKTGLKNAGKQLLTTAAHELGRRALAELSLAPVASHPADRRPATAPIP
jgi:hypothetical protein